MPSYSKKVWKARIVQFPGRRLKTATADPNVSDYARAEGPVTQAGDAFSTGNMNDLENRVETAFAAVDTQITAPTPTRSTTQQTYAPVTTLPTNTKNGLVKGLVKGVSLYNNSRIVPNSTYIPTGVGARIKVNTEKVVTTDNNFSPSLQTINIKANDKWFLYAKTDANTLYGITGFQYSNNTEQATPLQGAVNASNEAFGFIIANVTLSANHFVYDNVTGTTTSTKLQNFASINTTALGYESLTSEQMVDLCRVGYFEGLIGSTVDIEVVGVNKFDKTKATPNKYIGINGQWVDSIGNSGESDWIPSNPNQEWVNNGGGGIATFWDSQKNFVSGVSDISWTFPNFEGYLRMSTPPNEWDTLMLNKGTIALPYQPFKSSKLQLPQPLHKVPSIADQYNLETGQLTKNVGSGTDGLGYILKASDVIAIYEGYTAIKVVIVQLPNDFKRQTAVSESDVVATSITKPGTTFIDSPSVIGTHLYGSSFTNQGEVAFIVDINAYANLEAAKTGLDGTIILYQLTTPVITTIDKDLLSFENGTLYQNGRSVIAYTTPTNQGATTTDQNTINEHAERRLNEALPSASYTAEDVVAKYKTLDGINSGTDTDLWRGRKFYSNLTELGLSGTPTLQQIVDAMAVNGECNLRLINNPNMPTTYTQLIIMKNEMQDAVDILASKFYPQTSVKKWIANYAVGGVGFSGWEEVYDSGNYGAEMLVSSSFTLTELHNRKRIIVTGATVIITIPTGLATDFECVIMNDGSGAYTFVASGTTLNSNPDNTKRTSNGPISSAFVSRYSGAEAYYLNGNLKV